MRRSAHGYGARSETGASTETRQERSDFRFFYSTSDRKLDDEAPQHRPELRVEHPRRHPGSDWRLFPEEQYYFQRLLGFVPQTLKRSVMNFLQLPSKSRVLRELIGRVRTISRSARAERAKLPSQICNVRRYVSHRTTCTQSRV